MGGARESRARAHDLRVEKFQCDKIFTGEKNNVKKFRPLHAWAKKAKILSGRKFPAIRYIV